MPRWGTQSAGTGYGPICGGTHCGTKGETRPDGVMRGNTTLAGADEAGKPIGVWLGGEP